MSPVRQRILQIRRRVAAVAVTVFIALFSAIYVQMATGNDPALGSGTTTASTTSSTASSTGESSSSDESSSSSAVTTRQS
jgi:hypothetical protein